MDFLYEKLKAFLKPIIILTTILTVLFFFKLSLEPPDKSIASSQAAKDKLMGMLQPDVPDTPDVPDEPDAPDTPDTPDVPDEPDAPDTPDVPDEPDAPDTPDVPDEPDAPDTPDVPDEPDAPDTPDTPDVPRKPNNDRFGIKKWLKGVLRDLFSEHMRKLAHFLEYSFLGLEMVIIVSLYVENKKKGVILSILGGFAVAAIDEFLQIFSGRGASFIDVMIDFSGFLVGFLLYYGIAVAFVKLSDAVKVAFK